MCPTLVVGRSARGRNHIISEGRDDLILPYLPSETLLSREFAGNLCPYKGAVRQYCGRFLSVTRGLAGSDRFLTMNYQRLLSGWIVFEWLIIIVGKNSIPSSVGYCCLLLAFGLGIALKAKEASAWEDLGTIDPSLAPYDNVLDFINYYLFVVSPLVPLPCSNSLLSPLYFP